MRIVTVIAFGALALLFFGAGFVLPAYFQAVDPGVVELAGREGESRAEAARALEVAGAPDAAAFLLEGKSRSGRTEASAYPFRRRLAAEVSGPDTSVAAGPLLTRAGRAGAARLLRGDGGPGVPALLDATPAEPTPGSPPEALERILPARIGGLLAASLAADRAYRSPFLARLVEMAGAEGVGWMAFCRRLAAWSGGVPYGALAEFLGEFDDPATFAEFSALAEERRPGERGLLLRMTLAGADPAKILAYLREFPADGFGDLETAFASGPGAVDYLLERDRPLRKDAFVPATVTPPGFEAPARFAYERPEAALAARVVLFTAGFFFLLAALSRFVPNPGDRGLARPSPFQNLVRRLILSSIPAGTVLFFLEPSLLRQPETAPVSADSGRPSLASLTEPPATAMNPIEIDQVTLLILLIFLVLQVGLYVFCLVKLSEIRRQRVPDEMKLRLLDNEENLFDGGLYLGLGGTVASLIFLAVGVVEASLMAAYASTLFGIIFVSLFKIFHLRPLKRRLILSSRTAG